MLIAAASSFPLVARTERWADAAEIAHDPSNILRLHHNVAKSGPAICLYKVFNSKIAEVTIVRKDNSEI
jgi:hypothetical protein